MTEKDWGVKYVSVQVDMLKAWEKSAPSRWTLLKSKDPGCTLVSDLRFIAFIPENHFFLRQDIGEPVKVDDSLLHFPRDAEAAYPSVVEEKGKYTFRLIESATSGRKVWVDETILKKYFYYKDTLGFYITDEKHPVFLAKDGALRGVILPCIRRGEDHGTDRS